ncbi:MAG: gamma-glutamyl-gamma-aminobutyrate hydrolase family protein [Deltaproteobacteria bacterium]|nr:gamma-glutamyl-gamma-aminobutyrate hydrolase family protein [Deltaproteobacteria bacterium]
MRKQSAQRGEAERSQPGRRWIGVTTYRRESEGRERFTLPAAYVNAVREVGGVAVLLAPGEATPEELLARLDGLVLSGGGDLDPQFSRAEEHASVYGTCPERDAFEIALARAAVARDLPTLAICRGLQVLNVARGGTLHAHLPDVVGDEVAHRSSQVEATSHPVSIEACSDLADALGGEALASVPSWHHQAIAQLGDGLTPIAWAADGVIEAVELVGARRLTAVQWHPELDMAPGAAGRRLFEQLVRR